MFVQGAQECPLFLKVWGYWEKDLSLLVMRVKSFSTILKIVYFYSLQLANNLFLVTVAKKVHPSLWRHPTQGMEHKELVTKNLTEREEATQVLS